MILFFFYKTNFNILLFKRHLLLFNIYDHTKFYNNTINTKTSKKIYTIKLKILQILSNVNVPNNTLNYLFKVFYMILYMICLDDWHKLRHELQLNPLSQSIMFFDELLLVLRNPFVIDKFTARSHSKNLLKSSHSRSRTNTTFRFLVWRSNNRNLRNYQNHLHRL